MPRRTPLTPGRRVPTTSLALLAVVAAVAVASCGGEERRTGDADLQVGLRFRPDPPRVGTAEVGVEVSEVDWTPHNGATVILTGLRDGVTLVVDTARGQGAGRYLAPAFRFEAGGDWVVRVRVETIQGRWVEVERALRVDVGSS